MSEVSERLRVEWAKGDQARDAGLTTPAYIRRYNDIPYGDDRDWNVLDVYRNRYKAGKLPVIMLIHGGGWVYGSKELYQYYGMELARRGFAVVNYSYRLAPEHPFPAQLQDTVAAAAWIMKHADEYGFDLNNIFAVGDSSRIGTRHRTNILNPPKASVITGISSPFKSRKAFGCAESE